MADLLGGLRGGGRLDRRPSTRISSRSQDPDSFLRLVQVRDLLAGQGWFDLVQHRMDPPGGALLHWSRLIDAPIAGLILSATSSAPAKRFALTAWPLLLLFAMMGGAAAIGVRARRARRGGLVAGARALLP